MMLLHTEESEGYKYHIPLTDYSASKAQALLTGSIPQMIPVALYAASDGVEQFFDLNGLVEYQRAVREVDTRQMLGMLHSLCQNVMQYPLLMDEGLELLALDRLFWEPLTSCWRYLMLIADSEAWMSLPERTPDEIWSALFSVAMEASPEKRCVLQSIVDKLADKEFTVEELSLALEEELSLFVQEITQTVTDDETSTEDSEPEEEEYRPWEAGGVRFPGNDEIGLTGSTAGEPIKRDQLICETNREETPLQPVIPGIAPPPPPPSSIRKSVPEQKDAEMADAGTATTVLLKPETSVLDNVAAPGSSGTSIGRVPVAKMKIPRVVRMETQEMAYVDRPNFVIGSKAGAVDFLIRDNRVISRRHAAIVTRGTDYYIVDLGSRNGVFVENKRIQKNQETLIYVGDVFTLANEKFKLQW